MPVSPVTPPPAAGTGSTGRSRTAPRPCIVELGANDALRGLDPKIAKAALEDIIKKLQARKIAVMLAGMVAPRNYGPDYAAKFDPIYADLAKAHDVPLYPFFLDGVRGRGEAQSGGRHPSDGRRHRHHRGAHPAVGRGVPEQGFGRPR